MYMTGNTHIHICIFTGNAGGLQIGVCQNRTTLGFVETATSDSEEVDDITAVLEKFTGIILSSSSKFGIGQRFHLCSLLPGIFPTYWLVNDLFSEICGFLQHEIAVK